MRPRKSSQKGAAGTDLRSWLFDPVSVERAKLAFDTFVDPAEIDRVFDIWRDALAL